MSCAAFLIEVVVVAAAARDPGRGPEVLRSRRGFGRSSGAFCVSVGSRARCDLRALVRDNNGGMKIPQAAAGGESGRPHTPSTPAP